MANGLARIMHESQEFCPNALDQKALGLSYPKQLALKPEAQAKECSPFPSLALQASASLSMKLRHNLTVRQHSSEPADPFGGEIRVDQDETSQFSQPRQLGECIVGDAGADHVQCS